MHAWLGHCVRFAWQQCADTEGKRVVNAMGYIDRCRPKVGKFALFILPTGGAMSCESSVLYDFNLQMLCIRYHRGMELFLKLH